MIQKKSNNKINSRGFTIVELLVVIVVIGILAAITIVSYTGITNKANTASAQQAASNVMAKAEVYKAEGVTGYYPNTMYKLTNAATTTTYYMSGVTWTGTQLAAAPASPSTLNYFNCGTGATDTAPANLAAITTLTGVRIGYWNYSTGLSYVDLGTITGTVGTKAVACYITTVNN